MKCNLILIINKAGVSVAVSSVEYNTKEAAEAAVSTLRQGLQNETAYSLRYFITYKGESDVA